MTSPRGLLLVCLVLVLGAAMASGCSSVSDRVPRRVHAGVAAFAQPSLGCPVEAIPVRHPKSESMNASTSLRGGTISSDFRQRPDLPIAGRTKRHGWFRLEEMDDDEHPLE